MPKALTQFLQFLILVVPMILAAPAVPAATFVVTSSADTAGSSCAAVCTLRQAITAANATAAADTINFDIFTIPPRGDILIQPLSNLPPITQPLTINGYSQAGTRVNDSELATNATLRIRIDGAASSTTATHGLAVCASGSNVRGVAVTRFIQHGVIVGDSPCTAGVSNVLIQGNFLGTNGGGSSAAGNTGSGIRVNNSAATIGGAALADRNLLAANGLSGIELRGSNSSNVSIQNNLIGTDRSGSQDFGNATGIRITDSYNNAFIQQNLIRFNGTGIHLLGGVNNNISQNRIYDNDGLGIDLGALGVTPNDPNDIDNGPNQLQNFPVITSAGRGPGVLNVAGTLDVGHTNPIDYIIEAFASTTCDPSGNGEGERYLGSMTRGLREITQTFSGAITTNDPLPPQTVITLTVRSANAVGTSEFSQCLALDPPPLLVNSADDVDDGTCNAVHCSLREAMNVANSFVGAGQQAIEFAIPPLTGTSEITITPASPLPVIAQNYLIDGYSQPGAVPNTDPSASNAVVRIRLAGSLASPIGLEICIPSPVIRGLSLTGFEEAISMHRPACPLTSGGTISGNFFGLRADGLTLAANVRSIKFDGAGGANLKIGGTDPAERNVFAGGSIGIDAIPALSIQSVRTVEGNLFGTDRTGQQNFGIATAIRLSGDSANVLIGSADAPNQFAFNNRGIVVVDTARAMGFAENRFRAHGQLAIDLGEDGVTPNDPGDPDGGPNGRINFPVLSLAERNVSGLRVIGQVDLPGSPTAGELTVTLYASATCHPSGNGEGEQVLGRAGTTENFDLIIETDADLVASPFITATATTSEGTSEFSACLQATDPLPGIAVDTAVDSLTVDGGCDVVGDANLCTLREALLLANSQPGPDRIRFQIPGGAATQVIQPVALLPSITGGLSIEGYTQAGSLPNASSEGFDAVLRIELRPVGLSNGLRICTTELVDLSGMAFVTGTGPMIATQTNEAGNCALVGSLRVRGCQFGIRADGSSSAVANAILASGSTLTAGGPALADRNLFARSTGTAVRIEGSSSNGSVVQNNLFGRDGDGLSHPNARDIDIVNASQVTVGGDGLLGNAFFGSTVAVFVSGPGADFNQLYGNRFSQHSGATAIDLADGASPDGITPNDPDDLDEGANEGQNTPVLQSGSVTAPDTIQLAGMVDVPSGISAPVNYRLAFYQSSSCNDAASVGREGEVYLGSVLQPISSSSEAFSVSLEGVPQAGFITATVTSPGGSTSEFSNCLAAPRPDNLHADGFE